MLKKKYLLILIVVALLAMITEPAYALPPYTEEGDKVYEHPGTLDCSVYGYEYEIIDITEMHWKDKFFFNQDGSLNRIQSHMVGTDTMINTVTGKKVSGNFAVTQNIFPGPDETNIIERGLSFHVTYPGMGIVVLDSGIIAVRIWFENGEQQIEITYTNGPKTIFIDDYGDLCATLDGPAE